MATVASLGDAGYNAAIVATDGLLRALSAQASRPPTGDEGEVKVT